MGPILFYDGTCGLCHGFVGWCAARDTEGVLTYAPLQGETAKAKLPEAVTKRLDTVVLLHRGVLYYRSDAALRTAALLPKWHWTSALLRIPQRWRDGAYNAVAANRYAWFGQKNQCELPAAKGLKMLP